MADSQPNPRIGVEAARMAVEWKNLFARELQSAAQGLARGAELITVEHYRQAIPDAVSKVLHAAKTEGNSANVQRRVA